MSTGSTLRGASVLITGGTGSFGRCFTRYLLDNHDCRRVIIFSRDELKQHEMQQSFIDPRLRFFIGDVRDADRLELATLDVDIIVHAAALKQVPACEYNPFEAVKTNVLGSQNVISAALRNSVTRSILISTDKAVNPVNLYGSTKACAEKLFVHANAYSGKLETRFGCVRYGNVVGSRGSVVPLFRQLRERGTLPITDARMTRFWITLPQAIEFVADAIDSLQGGEVLVPKIPSMKVVDLARAIAPECEHENIGIRPGEKIHELLITGDEARHTIDVGSHFVIEPEHGFWSHAGHSGAALPAGFVYASDSNPEWLEIADLRELIEEL